jgi:hypothetical protein
VKHRIGKGRKQKYKRENEWGKNNKKNKENEITITNNER